MTTFTIMWVAFWLYFMLRMHRASQLMDWVMNKIAELDRADFRNLVDVAKNRTEANSDESIELSDLNNELYGHKSLWWRWDEFKKVSFTAMCFQVWKPLKVEAFWDDLSFLEE